MDFKDDEIKRLQLAAEAEEKKRFLQNVGSIEKVINESQSKIAPKAESAPSSDQPVAPQDKPSLKQIRTFQGDVASALESQKESLVSIQKRQALKNEAVEREEGPKEESHWGRTVGLIFGSMFLIGLGSLGGYFAYLKFKEQTAAPVIPTAENRLISVREENNIDTTSSTRESLINIVRTKSQESVDSTQFGEVVHLNLRKGVGELAPLVSTSEFIVLIEGRAPSALVRAFDSIFMLGILKQESGKPFLLLRLDSFEQAFPGMLEWEENLRDDLLPFFATEPDLLNTPQDQLFEDLTIGNKDTRALRDSSGKTVLIYTFIDNELLLITDDENSLRSLLNLISAQKLSR